MVLVLEISHLIFPILPAVEFCFLAINPILPYQNVLVSIGHPLLSLASPVNLRLRVGPRALSGKKNQGTRGEEPCLSVSQSVRLERSKGE